ncbi:MAG: ferrous iron transport protein B [Calditrichia bacterium]
MRIALVGQPNCGKSTIFNHIVGYKAYTANFPGASVNYTYGEAKLNGVKLKIYDLPGLYSLSSSDKAEEVSKQFLFTEKIDLIINVIDASVLARSLELTLELMETGIPLIVDLNMIDEADKKGMTIDLEKLSSMLSVPVVSTIGTKGVGVKELFRKAMSKEVQTAATIRFEADIEQTLSSIISLLNKENFSSVNPRLMAIKILEEDEIVSEMFSTLPDKIREKIIAEKEKIKKIHDVSGPELINHARHAKALSIFESVVTFHKIKSDFRDKIDNILLHNVFGYIILISVLFGMFFIIFQVGSVLEEFLLANYENIKTLIEQTFPAGTFMYSLIDGILQGIGGGVAIVLPYLVPFLLLLSLLEDIGYLPRIAYLMDALMHKIGLHGTSIIPSILGYGCNVPAVMATRILTTPRDRFLAAVIAAMVPCSARMTVIFGLVAFYLGPFAALFIYLLNIFVLGGLGHLLSKLMPEVSPGMIMEIPPYHLPNAKTVVTKIWLRLREFIVIAWPILIIGSIILNIITYTGFDVVINNLLYPITWLLDLPKEVGNTLIFGVLRKELSMIMLLQALGTTDVSTVMTYTQILTFTMFVTFYIPCVATMGVLIKEVGGKHTALIVVISLILAIIIGWLTKIIYPIIG